MIQQTMILFAVVILFGLFHILRIILNIEEFLGLDNRKIAKEKGCEWLQYWTIIASPVSHLLLQLNSSFNFIIYCYFNKSFREKLIVSISAIKPKFLKIICCQNINEINSTEECTLPKTRMSTLNNVKSFEKRNVDPIESVDNLETNHMSASNSSA